MRFVSLARQHAKIVAFLVVCAWGSEPASLAAAWAQTSLAPQSDLSPRDYRFLEETANPLSVKYVRIPVSSTLISRIRIITPSYRSADATGKTPDISLSGADGLNLADYQRLSRSQLVVSGGLLRSFDPVAPLGFVRSGGVTTSQPRIDPDAPRRGFLLDSGICFDPARPPVILEAINWDRDTWLDRTRDYADCIQTGPLIVRNGAPWGEPRTFPSGEHNFDRTSLWSQLLISTAFFCLDREGAAILGLVYRSGAFGDTAMDETIEALRSAGTDQNRGPACLNATRLTSGRTAGLRIGSQLLGLESYRLPNVIVIVP